MLLPEILLFLVIPLVASRPDQTLKELERLQYILRTVASSIDKYSAPKWYNKCSEFSMGDNFLEDDEVDVPGVDEEDDEEDWQLNTN